LRQVFLNLLINAVDAITCDACGQQGTIGIRTLLKMRPTEFSTGGTNENIVIAIEDNGPGIPGEHIENIFDPFYTTKEPGKGTGLGLSVSFMIIEKFGGTILAESTDAKGTVMSIYLPVTPTGNAKQEQHG